MEEILRQVIEGQTGVLTSWGLNPQGVDPPRITLTMVSSFDHKNSCGYGGLLNSRVQANCYGSDYLEARDVSVMLIDVVSTWVRGDKIHGVLWENARDGNDGNVTELRFWRSVDLLVVHRKP